MKLSEVFRRRDTERRHQGIKKRIDTATTPEQLHRIASSLRPRGNLRREAIDMVKLAHMGSSMGEYNPTEMTIALVDKLTDLLNSTQNRDFTAEEEVQVRKLIGRIDKALEDCRAPEDDDEDYSGPEYDDPYGMSS